MTEKLCPKCQQTLPITSFSKSKQRKDGHAGHCKECHHAYSKSEVQRGKAKDYRGEHKQEAKSYSVKYRAENSKELKEKAQLRGADPVVKSRRATYKRDWWDKNKEQVYSRQREWRYVNVDKASATSLRWMRKNPMKVRETRLKRRALRVGAEGEIAKGYVEKLYERQEGKCNYCSKELFGKFDVDHIQPLSKGGNNTNGNIQILCPSCNRRKSNLDEAVFLKRAGYATPQRSIAL